MFLFGQGSLADFQIGRDSLVFKKAFEDKVAEIDKLLEQKGLNQAQQGFKAPFLRALKKSLSVGHCDQLLDRVESPSISSCWPRLQFLNKDQLKFLSQIVEKSTMDPEDSSLEEFPMKSFLQSGELSPNEAKQYVQILMLLSELARKLLEVKSVFHSHQNGVMEVMDRFITDIQQEQHQSSEPLLYSHHHSNQLLRSCLENKLPQLWECGVWMRRLQRYGRIIMKKLVQKTHQSLQKNLHFGTQALYAIQVWLDSEKLKQSDGQYRKEWAHLDFAKVSTDLRHSIYQRLDMIEHLLEVIAQQPSEKLIGLSDFLHTLVGHHQNLYQRTLHMDMVVDRQMKAKIKILLEAIQQAKIKCSRVRFLEFKELENHPEIIKKQISYFQSQVPDVMFRGNGSELKMISLTLGHCYRRLPKLLKSHPNPDVQRAQKDFTKLVINTTELVKKLHQCRRKRHG